MPSSSSLLPGPHDPYNASSVKLAEATRIRLILPGLGAVDKEESAAGAVKRTGTGDTCQKPAAESAAAVAKARKKLLKIQGIANQAEKAHSSVIVDQRVLAAKAAVDEQGDAGSYGSGAGSAAVRGGGAAAGASLEKRTSRQGSSRAAIAGDAPSTGTPSGAVASQQLRTKRRSAIAGADAGRCGSQLTLLSPDSTAAAAAADGDSAGSSTCSSAPSNRRGQQQSDRPQVPIWERLLPPPTPAEEKKLPVTTPKLFQPVAIKTFSPTLGSLCSNLPQESSRASEEPAATARGAGSWTKSAGRSLGQPPEVAAGAAQQRHPQFDSAAHHLSTRHSSSLPANMALRSKSFTGSYQSPSQLFEKLTF